MSTGSASPRLPRRRAGSPCSACGLSKRYILNRYADENGYDVLVMGHNLDDEAATLFSNVLRWNAEYLEPAAPGAPATRSRGSCARSSHCCGWPNGKRPPTRSSQGSSTKSTSARWQRQHDQ